MGQNNLPKKMPISDSELLSAIDDNILLNVHPISIYSLAITNFSPEDSQNVLSTLLKEPNFSKPKLLPVPETYKTPIYKDALLIQRDVNTQWSHPPCSVELNLINILYKTIQNECR